MNKEVTNLVFTEEYKEICFQVWYSSGRPPTLRIRDYLPPDSNGRKPSISTFDNWKEFGMWNIRADEIDAKAIQLSDEYLIQQKVEMLRRHADQAKSLSDKARDFLITDGFDSSASAVNAYFRGTEEERKARGISDLIEKLSKMTDPELQDKILDMLRRGSENNQIIDSASIEEDNAKTGE